MEPIQTILMPFAVFFFVQNVIFSTVDQHCLLKIFRNFDIQSVLVVAEEVQTPFCFDVSLIIFHLYTKYDDTLFIFLPTSNINSVRMLPIWPDFIICHFRLSIIRVSSSYILFLFAAEFLQTRYHLAIDDFGEVFFVNIEGFNGLLDLALSQVKDAHVFGAKYDQELAVCIEFEPLDGLVVDSLLLFFFVQFIHLVIGRLFPIKVSGAIVNVIEQTHHGPSSCVINCLDLFSFILVFIIRYVWDFIYSEHFALSA